MVKKKADSKTPPPYAKVPDACIPWADLIEAYDSPKVWPCMDLGDVVDLDKVSTSVADIGPLGAGSSSLTTRMFEKNNFFQQTNRHKPKTRPTPRDLSSSLVVRRQDKLPFNPVGNTITCTLSDILPAAFFILIFFLLPTTKRTNGVSIKSPGGIVAALADTLLPEMHRTLEKRSSEVAVAGGGAGRLPDRFQARVGWYCSTG